MRRSGVWVIVAACVGVALSAGVACGGGGGGSSSPVSPTPELVASATPEMAASPTPEPTPSPQPTPPRVFTPGPLESPVPPGRGDPSGRIAFVSFRDGQQEIYVVNAAGGGLRNVSNDEAADFDPDWSPDGSKIAFASTREGAGIYSMNADGTDATRLTKESGGISPKWSPDGARIAYSRGGSIVIIGQDGSNPTTVHGGGAPTPGVPCSGGAVLGDWSPDGAWIVFYSGDLSRGASEICAVAADGSDLRLIVKDPPGIHAEPNWSPDGTRIAFRSIREGVHHIYVYDLAAGEEIKLTEYDGLDAEPAWSPDGGWVAFVSDRDSIESDIYVMSADGSDVRRLTTDPRKDSFPTWTP